MARHPRWLLNILREEDLDAVTRAIAEAETGTSAEIRVHLERHVHHPRWTRTTDVMTRARDVFAHLAMHRTRHRGAVLIYLALEDRKLAIVGDDGIHAHVGDEYWTGVRDLMVERLRAGAIREALVRGVGEVAAVLARHFPRRPDDVDELSDQISSA
jgi:uncharacterized membrane protein